MNLPEDHAVFDLSEGYDPLKITKFVMSGGWAVGGYNEKRGDMYLAPQYDSRRNVHMGIDIWARPGELVYAAFDGFVAYKAHLDEEGNYGGTLVLKHSYEGKELFALYGHLAFDSLASLAEGRKVKAGEKVGRLGDETENGNWPPHLHYQLSWNDPGEADMPGVVSEEEREAALQVYPDPAMLLDFKAED